jgi:hypothetical protein
MNKLYWNCPLNQEQLNLLLSEFDNTITDLKNKCSRDFGNSAIQNALAHSLARKENMLLQWKNNLHYNGNNGHIMSLIDLSLIPHPFEPEGGIDLDQVYQDLFNYILRSIPLNGMMSSMRDEVKYNQYQDLVNQLDEFSSFGV